MQLREGKNASGKTLSATIITLALIGGPLLDVKAEAAFAPAIISSNVLISVKSDLSGEEKAFLSLLNQFRARLGLTQFMIDDALQLAARKHSLWMSDMGILQHNGPYRNYTFADRFREAGFFNYTWAGENIACGNASGDATLRQWVNSPGHLQNIINPHFHFVGIAREGNANQPCPFFWTNDFGSTSDGATDVIPVITPEQIQNAIQTVN